MTIHVTPIPSTIDLTTPAFVLGETNTAGAQATAIASDSGLALFNTATGLLQQGNGKAITAVPISKSTCRSSCACRGHRGAG